MKFKKTWESIKTTPEAKRFIKVFNKTVDANSSIEEIVAGYHEVMANIGEELSPEDASWQTFQLMANLPDMEDNANEVVFFESFVDNLEIWYTYIDQEQNIVQSTKKKDCFIGKGNYRALNNWMNIISCFLYNINPFYKPMFYSNHFDWIQRNCDFLDIRLPELPRTNDYRKYTMYYLELCKSFAKYQEENDLNDAEFICYMYYFAHLQIDETQESELPRPTNVWLTGANPWDYERLETEGICKSAWACNERTQRGDIVIVYAVSPNSCFHSIWRANSGGCFNPFSYYHCRTTVVDCHPIPHVTYKEFMNDPVLSDFTIGHKNLQGVNGFELSSSEYASFISYLEKKCGYDISELPRLVNISTWTAPEIVKGNRDEEKQVENKYIKPLLHDILGYTEEDYTQQARHKSGRKEKSIPDFVFFQKGEHGLEHCPFLIEAKVDFKSTRQRRKDYEQGLSYAQTYRSKLMSIMDRHRVIVYHVDEYGCADYAHPAFEQQWEVIYSDPGIQSKLISLIGREVIKNIK
ncbi:MAG: type I restriction enzyme HsdR N-terminal domain-containing protein [Bacteroidaceae bacterium]|nr:type I restriction enzyme HsdR N-terminal domain-containing protein [Bacteroidaceae bacterium]